MPTSRRLASPCGSARLAPRPPAPGFRRGGYQGWGCVHTALPIKNPFRTRFGGRKRGFRGSVRRECRIRAALCLCYFYTTFSKARQITCNLSPCEAQFSRLSRALPAHGRIAEQWPSGRRRTPGKCVYVKSVSRVRIPPAPPPASEKIEFSSQGSPVPINAPR